MKNPSPTCLLLLLCCGVFLSCVAAQQQPIKIIPANPKLYELYEGNYRLADDRFISLGAFSENGDRLTFYDSKTRRVGVLYDLSDTDFVSGIPRGNDSIEQTDLRVTFSRDGRGEVTGLVWREGNIPAITAQKVSPHRNEEIVFQNGDVTLHGTLTLPATEGRHPAVLFLQGSGPARRPYGMWPYFLARYGIATLVYDKRGAGASTGNWQTASFGDLAGDALAAVNLLRKHPSINNQQIGLWGNSNSGWVVPIVAARSKDVAFVISRVGSTLPPHENILYEIENDARQRGFTEREVEQAVALRRKYHQAILTNTGWDQLRAEVERSRNERWFGAARMGGFLTLQIPPDAATLTALRNTFVFDPMPFWERVTCPVLALYGEMDMNVPTVRTMPMLDAALKRAGNKDYTITVLPNANHGLAEVSAPSSSEPPRVRRYASGYMDGIADWLLKRLSVNSRPSRRKPIS
ncbi:MAG: alpha/beta fold hydrolase [Acidobacteriota bacterium]|nr:alpha/beta fold hydrolase [Acidobacteriota bacterium]